MSSKIQSFHDIKMVSSIYEITSGTFKGWKIHIVPMLKKVVLDGISEDGTPKFTLAIDIISTPTPPPTDDITNL
jgi:hypothetical protein